MGLLSIAMLTSVALSAPRIAVIGGGASGIFAGITAAESATDAVKVVVMEATRETLTKVSISGGGRVRLFAVIYNLFRCLQCSLSLSPR